MATVSAMSLISNILCTLQQFRTVNVKNCSNTWYKNVSRPSSYRIGTVGAGSCLYAHGTGALLASDAGVKGLLPSAMDQERIRSWLESVLFSDFTLFVWQQERRLACKNLLPPPSDIFGDLPLLDRSNSKKTAGYTDQGSAIADKPARRAASRRTCYKQIRWTLSVINLRPN